MKPTLVADILPTPQQLTFRTGSFRMKAGVSLYRPVCSPEADARSARLLAAGLREATGTAPRELETTRYVNHHVLYLGTDDAFELPLDFVPPRHEGYALRVDAKGVLIAGADAAGLFYGVQTLLQVLRLRREAKGPAIPAVDVRDWPAMRYRAAMIDIARQVEKPEAMEALVRRLAAYKTNMFVLYFEDKFHWRKHQDLSHPFGYEPEEFGRLARLAEDNHMEFVPALASLGHCEGFLQHESIARLREDGAIYQLSLRQPGTRRLLEDLYSEILPLYRGRFFHVNCDESPLLAGPPGSGPGYLKESLRLFGEHLIFLHDLLARHGKEMMVWGDMLLHYPQIRKDLPRDIIVVDWDYGSMVTRRREAPALFLKEGFRVMVAPAAMRSAEVYFPQEFLMTENVPYFLRHGQEAGAMGEMCTVWEMFSTHSFQAAPALITAAQYAWNPQAVAPAKFPRVMAANLYGPGAAEGAAEGAAKAHHFLSSDLFLKRYFDEAKDPASRRRRTYHLDSHEFVATDPMVYLNYRPTLWADSVVRQARRGIAEADAAVQGARWNRGELETFRLAGQQQAFQALRRVAVNEAGRLAVQAERLRRKGRLAKAADCLQSGANCLGDLSAIAEALIAPTRHVWSLTRHVEDPGLEECSLRRFRLSRDGLRAGASRMEAAAKAVRAGRPESDVPAIGGQPVLVLRAVNPVDNLIDLLKMRITYTHDGQNWRVISHKNWFLLEGQTYFTAVIPEPPQAATRLEATSKLPGRIRFLVTRTDINPRRYPLKGRIAVLTGRTLTPAEILDGPPTADLDTTDWRIVFTPKVKYRLDHAEGWTLEYRREE